MANGPCALYGKHRMKNSVLVGVRDTNGNYISNEFRTGQLFTCGCNDRIITSGSPNTGDYIRSYVTEGGIQASEWVYSIAGGYWKIPKKYIYYQGSSTLPGYEFM
mgnify:CR=1 FL=1